MNDTAIASQNLIISNYLPLAIVIVGGFLTYFFTITIEKQKQEYELKKQVYFDALDTIIDTRRLFNRREKIRLQLKRDDERAKIIPILGDLSGSLPAYNAVLDEIEANMKSLALQRAKIGICSNQEIKNLVDKIVDNIYKDQDDFMKIVNDELIPEMKKDLISWQNRKYLSDLKRKLSAIRSGNEK